jgi:hypothetical protein
MRRIKIPNKCDETCCDLQNIVKTVAGVLNFNVHTKCISVLES